MNYYDLQVVLQEVPGEISLCFSITGCRLNCEGCHSSFLRKNENGNPLTDEVYNTLLKKYKGFASCVLFMGGEWHPEKLANFLQIANDHQFKTCLYTGEEKIPDTILKNLTWVKTGRWISKLGALESEKTNQRFIEVKTNRTLNHLFIQN
jgi:anaerobic ribonucleoside-triphosphate reductase activating protein